MIANHQYWNDSHLPNLSFEHRKHNQLIHLLYQYVEWIANRRLRSIGLKPLYDIPAKNNPLPWTEHWISSKGLQVAPQETEVESYVVGGIKQDVKKDTFSGFKL